jgi:alkanesulfonate monooxygenase SsuD/methylene tetrahydromethanopterin reductase-like flavin-dependent oxidoreductase (luciferase family)
LLLSYGSERDPAGCSAGTGVRLAVERDPIITAKEVASLDHISGGRFEFGVDAGWDREEMRTTAQSCVPG